MGTDAGQDTRAEPQFPSNFEEILLSRSRKAAKTSKSSARRAAMPALDLRRGGRVFRAFEDDAKAITNGADDFESVRLISWQHTHRRLLSEIALLLKLSCEAECHCKTNGSEYFDLARSVRKGNYSASMHRRNETRVLSLMRTTQVKSPCRPEDPAAGVFEP